MDQREGQVANPDMIRLARELRGHSQSCLAHTLKVTQGRISKVESGQISASRDFMEALAGELLLPVEFFYQRDPVFGATLSYNRKRMSMTKSVLERVRAELNFRRLHLKRLANSVDMESPNPRYNIPTLDVDEWEGPEQIAAMVRAHWGVPPGPVKDVTAYIERGDGIIVEVDFPEKIDAEVQLLDVVGPIFFVSTRAPGDRLRWNLCHELGHAVMHSKVNPDVENQANRFAAAFLMPEDEIRDDLDSRVLTVERLAVLKQKWKVAMSALTERAFSLGIIGARQRKYLYMKMAPYRKIEPVEVERERPTKLKEMLRVHLEDLDYTESQLANLLCLTQDEYRRLYVSPKFIGTAPKLKLVRTGSI